PAVDGDGAAPLAGGGVVCLDHAPGPGDLVRGGGEDLVDDRDLARVDAPLAVVAHRPAEHGRAAAAVGVAEVGVGAVDHQHPRRAGGHEQVVHDVLVAVTGVGRVPFVEGADGSGGHSHRG